MDLGASDLQPFLLFGFERDGVGMSLPFWNAELEGELDPAGVSA